MINSKKYSLLLTLALLMATITVSSVYITAPAKAQASSDWPQWRYNPAHTGYNPNTKGPSQLRQVWQYRTEGMIRSSPAIVNGKVYIGSDDEYVYCLDGEDGSLEWRYKTEGAVCSSPAVVGGKVYFGSFDHYVYCLDADDGGLVWKYPAKYIIYSSPCVVDDKVFICSNDDHIYCLNAQTGTQVWNFTFRSITTVIPYPFANYPIPGDVNANYNSASPAVVGGKVYIGWGDAYVYCLDEATGAKIWECRGFWPPLGIFGGLSWQGFRESSPCVVGDAIYIGSLDSRWYKINATTGGIIWARTYNEALKTKEANDNVEQTSAAYYNGKLYYQYSSPHMAVQVDPATGYITNLGNMGIMCRSSCSAADGKVYNGNNDRGFYVWDADDMTRLQSIWFEEPIESSPSLADDKVYFGGLNRYVYCYEQGETQRLNNLYITPAPRTLSLGKVLTVSGGINPFHESGPEGQTVTLTYVRPDGTTVVRTTTTQAASVFSDAYTPDAEGTWQVKGSWAGNPWWLPGESYYQTFYVTAAVAKPSTTISASVSNATIVPGDAVTVSGAITPSVAGVTVTLTYTKPDATSLTRTSVSASGGAYTDTYTPDTEGDWNVKASWAGSDAYQSATSSAAAFKVSSATVEPTGGAIPMEIIYAVVAIVVIAIVAIVGYWYMKRPKK
jgi:outer membrane protein assembly factor BamB